MVLTLLQAPTASLRELALLAGRDPKNFYLGVEIRNLDLTGQDLSGMNFSEDVHSQADQQLELDFLPSEYPAFQVGLTAQRIKGAARQEERIALLLDEIFKDRAVGLSLLEAYSFDKAKFATRALGVLKEVLRNESHSKKLSNVQLARLVSGRFAKGPNTRTTLAYFMFKHLRKYPDIDRWISSKSISRLYLSPAHWKDFQTLIKHETKA